MSSYSINSSGSGNDFWLDEHAPDCPAQCYIPRRHRKFYRGQLSQLDYWDDVMFEMLLTNSGHHHHPHGEIIDRPPHNAIKMFNSKIDELSFAEDSAFHSCPCYTSASSSSSSSSQSGGTTFNNNRDQGK